MILGLIIHEKLPFSPLLAQMQNVVGSMRSCTEIACSDVDELPAQG
jgi:hypothetical protein